MYKKNLKPIFNTQFDKNVLLNTGFFKNNNFLEKYLKIFEEPLEDTDKLESHNILPQAYFKISGKEIDNSSVRTITYRNHYLAHYYLLNCTIGLLKKSMTYEFNRMNLRISLVSYEFMSQFYEVLRVNDKENFYNYIKTAHNNINEYNKKFSKRPIEHVRKIQESKKIKKLKG